MTDSPAGAPRDRRQLIDLATALGPAAGTTLGLNAEEHLARSEQWAARAEVFIELAEKQAKEDAEKTGGDLHDYIDADSLCVLYAVTAFTRAQLAIAVHTVQGGAQ